MDRQHVSPAEAASRQGADPAAVGHAKDPPASFQQRYEQLGNGLAAALSTLVREKIVVQPAGVETLTYGEFVLRSSGPTCLHLANVEPDLGSIALETPPRLLGLLFDTMLGARQPESAEPRQPATDIEWRLLAKVVQRCLNQFQAGWQDVLPIEVRFQHSEPNARRLKMLAADRMVRLLNYDVVLLGAEAQLRVILADDWPATVAQRAAADSVPSQETPTPALADRQDERELIVKLADTDVTAEELANLSVGDVIQTDKDVGESLTVTVDGTARFRANLGKVGDKKAVHIVGQIAPPGDEDTAQ